MSSAPSPSPGEAVPVPVRIHVAAGVGGVGILLCLIAAFIPATRADFFRAWLLAFCLVLSVPLGSLVVIMLNYLVGGNWGFVLRRFLEAATRTLPLVTLLFVPLIFGLHDLYEWTHSEVLKHDEIIAKKAPYLNITFFLIRAAIYFAIWNLLVFLLNRWSRLQDTAKSPTIAGRCEALSAPGIILYALTITFASIDWVMSLEPHWYSTIFMAIFGMGQVLTGFVFCIIVLLTVYLRDNRPEREFNSETMPPQTLNDLGTLTFAFIMVWAYLSFCQFLLIWSGNLPVEVPYYTARFAGGWNYVAVALLVLHFAVPFFLLLNTQIKRNPRQLLGILVWVLVMRIVEMVWIVVPAFHAHHEGEAHGPSFAGILLYPTAVIGLGGLWLAYYLWQLQRWPLLPKYNPQEAAHGEIAHH